MPMPATGAFSMTLPVTALSASTAMPIPAPSSGSVPAGLVDRRLRIRLPCTTASRPPRVEIRYRHADRGPIHHVVGDHGPFEFEFGIQRHFLEAAAGIADHLDVRGGIAAHGGKGGVSDAVAAHDDVGCAEYVDGVAVLARAAAARGDILDAIVDHERAVVACLRPPDQDADVACLPDAVAADRQAARVE